MPGFTHMDGDGHPWMVDVSDKRKTSRSAIAEGWITMSQEMSQAILSRKNGKGDVLQVAELAGIGAVKRASELIPLCHPLRIDHCSVICEVDLHRGVHVLCEVKAGDVTGVEMEALTGVSIAALTIYDMCKAMDKGMEIEGIRLLEKKGGKSGEWIRDLEVQPKEEIRSVESGFSVGVLTVSDKGSKGERVDTSGPALIYMAEKLGFTLEVYDLVPDDKELISNKLMEWCDKMNLHLILVTGGTGLSPRDVTPEALLSVGDREVPGLGERMRSYSLSFTDRSVLSRTLAVTRGGSLILALPGSEKGATQCLEAIKSVLHHGIDTLRGTAGDCGHVHR